MREIPHSPVALYEVANLFGALVAETILASVQCASAQTGRTYGRKRSDQSAAKTSCEEGAVHIRGMSGTGVGALSEKLLNAKKSAMLRNRLLENGAVRREVGKIDR